VHGGTRSRGDAVFERLLAWRDDGDGRSTRDELLPLSSVGVRSISLRYTRSDRVDAHGNLLGLSGSARAKSGRVPVIDVWFLMSAR
jgi:hypothetical protein